MLVWIFFKNSFAYRGPFIWNELPDNIRKCVTLFGFKIALKAHVLNLMIEFLVSHCFVSYLIIYCNICRVYVSFTDILFTLSLNVYVIFTLTRCLLILALTAQSTWEITVLPGKSALADRVNRT